MNIPAFPIKDGKYYFAWDDGVHGSEPWVTDFFNGDTRLLQDLNPKPEFNTSYSRDYTRPQDFTQFQDLILFQGLDFSKGYFQRALWAMDGETCYILRNDFVYDGSGLHDFTKAGEHVLYFAARGASCACDGPWQLPRQGGSCDCGGLWKTDGTIPGTVLVGNFDYDGGGPQELTMLPDNGSGLGDRLIFLAWDPSYGAEIWTSRGTPETTYMLKDIAPGLLSTGYRFAGRLLSPPFRGYVYFGAVVDSELGLYRTDGTPSGTKLFYFLGNGMFDGNYTALNEGVFFTSKWNHQNVQGQQELIDKLFFWVSYRGAQPNGQMWVTDGTTQGTRMVKGNLWLFDDASLGPIFDGKQLFVGRQMPDDTADEAFFGHSFGQETWITDGTEKGTVRIDEKSPSYTNRAWGISLPDRRYLYGNAYQVYVTDGTEKGTVALENATYSSFHADWWSFYIPPSAYSSDNTDSTTAAKTQATSETTSIVVFAFNHSELPPVKLWNLTIGPYVETVDSDEQPTEQTGPPTRDDSSTRKMMSTFPAQVLLASLSSFLVSIYKS